MTILQMQEEVEKRRLKALVEELSRRGEIGELKALLTEMGIINEKAEITDVVKAATLFVEDKKPALPEFQAPQVSESEISRPQKRFVDPIHWRKE